MPIFIPHPLVIKTIQVQSAVAFTSVVTKTADNETEIIETHDLGYIPQVSTIAAATGTESLWGISDVNKTTITITCSDVIGTSGSTADLNLYELAGIDVNYEGFPAILE